MRPARVLAIAWVSAFAVSVYVAMVAVVLPRIAASLELTFFGATWVQVAFLLALTVVLVPAGRISDQGDRWRAFRLGVATFLGGSVLAAAAQNGAWLLAASAVQGAGAAFVWATNMPLITTAYPESERGRSLGIYVVSISVGRAVGPVVGGVVAQQLHWRVALLVTVPLLAAALLAAPSGRTRLDLRAVSAGHVVSLGTGLSAALVALTFAPVWGWTSARALVSVVVAIVAVGAFVVTQRRASSPLLDLEMFLRRRLLAVANASILLAHLATFGVMLLTAVYLQVAGGRTVQETGFILLAQSVAMSLVAPVAGRLSDRFGSRTLTTCGLLVVAAGLVLLGTLPAAARTVEVAVPLAIVGGGLATFLTPNTSAILGAVGPSDRGIAAATLATVRSLGQAASVAILGAIAARQLGPEGTRAIFLGGETMVAGTEAFASGFRAAMQVAAGIAVAGAVVSFMRGGDRPITDLARPSSEVTGRSRRDPSDMSRRS